MCQIGFCCVNDSDRYSEEDLPLQQQKSNFVNKKIQSLTGRGFLGIAFADALEGDYLESNISKVHIVTLNTKAWVTIYLQCVSIALRWHKKIECSWINYKFYITFAMSALKVRSSAMQVYAGDLFPVSQCINFMEKSWKKRKQVQISKLKLQL